MQTIHFENKEKFIKASADYILAEAISNVSEKDFFTISLTGGSTPAEIYNRLAKQPYKEKFPWDKSYFFLGDERILPPNSSDSNVFMINQSLFSNVDVSEENKIFPDVSLGNIKKIAQEYETKIMNFFKTDIPSFDLFLLGMGMDCHTASLFPEDSIWRDNDNFVIPTSKPCGEPSVYRISMGLKLINNSKNVLMLISGDEKRKIADKLLKEIEDCKSLVKSPIADINPLAKYVWHIN